MLGDISIRSRPLSLAISIASDVLTTPTFSPSAPIRRTSRERIRPLILIVSFFVYLLVSNAVFYEKGQCENA